MTNTMNTGLTSNTERIEQSKLMDFKGIVRDRNIRPTDIDGFIDYAGEMFLWFECKLSGTTLPTAQRIAFEHFIQALKTDIIGVALFYEHNEHTGKTIIAKDQPVCSVYANVCIPGLTTDKFRWQSPTKNLNVLQVIERIEEYHSTTKRQIFMNRMPEIINKIRTNHEKEKTNIRTT